MKLADWSRCLIIAEAGVNHDGDMAKARELIDVAVDAKADVVKFQTFRAERLVTRYAELASYQARNIGKSVPQADVLRALELEKSAHLELQAYCQERNIEFLSTPFDSESVRYLAELGVGRIKIPSGEITNLPYLRTVGSVGLPVILSTGMANLGEIEAALVVLESAGIPRLSISLLQCNTEYPTPYEDANLRAMETLRVAFPGVAVGYSDHTLGIEVPIAAVALGATVIEKHFTLSRDLEGLDHKASLEPAELKAMVAAIRNVEAAMGSGVKRPSASEVQNIAIVRKSIVAATAISQGELFSEENLTVKRPGSGICPMQWDQLLGRESPRDFDADELIQV